MQLCLHLYHVNTKGFPFREILQTQQGAAKVSVKGLQETQETGHCKETMFLNLHRFHLGKSF